MQSCDSTCAHCANSFWKWLKARIKSQDTPGGRSGPGNFNTAAVTSIKAKP